MQKREISILNDLKELERLNSFLEETAEEWNLSHDLLFQINLVAEEVVSNIIKYGYQDNQAADEILYELTLLQGALKICITDHAKEFNPLKVPPPDDLNKPLEERKIGGLGIYFIRQLMDQVEYRREDDRNILVLTKKF